MKLAYALKVIVFSREWSLCTGLTANMKLFSGKFFTPFRICLLNSIYHCESSHLKGPRENIDTKLNRQI
jgi:hypothetical protein